jgi:hypothetical protein
MKNKNVSELISELSKLNKDLETIVINEFSKLSDNQRSWRPSPEKWNINEVFSHLIHYYKFYNPVVRQRLATKGSEFTKSSNFTSSQLGRTFYRSMMLGKKRNIKKKQKALKSHNPAITPELKDPEAIKHFLEAHHFWLDIIERSKEVNLKKIKIPISISKMVKLRLGDTLLVISHHTDRHIEQALNIKRSTGFPS